MTTFFPAEQLRGATLTTLISAVFAAGWGLSGSAALPSPTNVLAALLVAVVTAVWLGAAYRFHRAAQGRPAAPEPALNPFRTRPYQLAVLAQFIAFPLAGRFLTAVGRPDAIMPAVAAIVGLHFFGLIPAFRSWRFAAVGGAMVLLAALSLALPVAVPLVPSGEAVGLRGAAIGFGSALILWAGALPVALAVWRELRAKS
ncbi:MAG TPA: hypothetical protein VFS21_29305 [Roseiflexaceae bacterium]|nr:hypothetical protein [Roseiflexaceae bacterium]